MTITIQTDFIRVTVEETGAASTLETKADRLRQLIGGGLLACGYHPNTVNLIVPGGAVVSEPSLSDEI